MPRILGQFEDEDITIAIGRFGPYARHKSKFYSLGKTYDPYSITLDEAIEVIEAKRKSDVEKHIKTFEENPEWQILNGRWGPYLKAGKMNIRIPKDTDPASLTYEDCVKLVENPPPKRGKGTRSKKK